MKKILKVIIITIIRMVSIVYTYKINDKIKGYINILYTMWIRSFLGSIPQDSTIDYPCYLQGGGSKHIFVGHHTGIQSHSVLGCWVERGNQQFKPSIKIGNNCHIGEYNQITACNKITIGDGLLTGRFVYLGDNSHGTLSWEEAEIPPAERMITSKGEILIGKNVWIGDKVTILAGVTVGDNAIIGANSVVTHDIPSNCVAAGIPAMVVKELK